MNQNDNAEYKQYRETAKWHNVVMERLNIDKHTCQMCGCHGTSVNPLEIHHFTYKHLYHEEEWIYEDLVTLCHSCHKLLHKGMERVTNEDGRKGWKDNPRIPDISVYTVTGNLLESIEKERNQEND